MTANHEMEPPLNRGVVQSGSFLSFAHRGIMDDKPDLISYDVNLTSTHLGQAVELYWASCTNGARNLPPRNFVLSSRNALSSIIHSYCTLESAVSSISYGLFFDTKSDCFLPPESRDIPLKHMIDSWKRVSLDNKFGVLMSLLGSAPLSARLTNELGEFARLRNLVLHGFNFKKTVFFQEVDDNNFIEVDREDNVKWQKDFPNTKFNKLDELDCADARTALKITLECLRILAKAGNSCYSFASYSNKVKIYKITAKGEQIPEILNMKLGAGPIN